jgi:hypothetical protein
LELLICKTYKAKGKILGSEILEQVLIKVFKKGRQALFFGSDKPAVAKDDLLLDVVSRPVELVRYSQLLDVVLQLFRNGKVRRFRGRNYWLYV